MTARFKPLVDGEMTEAQKKARDGIVSGPRGGMRGPFNALLRSPELAEHAQKLGAYIRFNSSLPASLNELAILIVARHWKAQYEWYAHAKLAAKAGLGSGLISSIEKNLKPEGMTPEETAVYNFCTELHQKKEVSDASFAAVQKHFGDKGVIDLIGASGYYTLVSMVLNVDRHPLPDGESPPLK